MLAQTPSHSLAPVVTLQGWSMNTLKLACNNCRDLKFFCYRQVLFHAGTCSLTSTPTWYHCCINFQFFAFPFHWTIIEVQTLIFYFQFAVTCHSLFEFSHCWTFAWTILLSVCLFHLFQSPLFMFWDQALCFSLEVTATAEWKSKNYWVINSYYLPSTQLIVLYYSLLYKYTIIQHN